MSKDDSNIMCRAIIIFDDKTTLVQYFKHYDTYITVGGHKKEDESLWDGLVREIFEESGLKIITEERKPDMKHGNNYYWILRDGDIDTTHKGFINHSDGGEIVVVPVDEFFNRDNPHKDEDKIKPDVLAITSALEKMN